MPIRSFYTMTYEDRPHVVVAIHGGSLACGLLTECGMMRDARSFHHSTRPLEAEDPLLDRAQLYAMPVPQERLEHNTVPFPVKASKLISMPTRWSNAARLRPPRQFPGIAVDWPRGYPAHDDL